MRAFYRDFAAAYGTCCLLVLIFALIAQIHIDTGLVGLIGFPAISLAYAFVRSRRSAPREPEPASWQRVANPEP